MAVQQSIFTRKGVDRIMKFAFELAMKRPRRKVTSATKSNGIAITMPYWDERFKAMAAQYPQVTTDQYHIDGLTIQMVLNPQRFDVIVASNLFGDILSDLGPATAGTIGVAPSANINPDGDQPSHLGHANAANAIERAIEQVLAEGPRTPDIGGKASTEGVGKAIAAAI
jgi:tartrate dehydrogenase/decarboxylase/D-malate dehydrogenase